MYLFPHPAPDLQIEILDAEHKSEHILFANRQKEHNFYLWYQNQDLFWRSWNRSRLAPQFQWSCTEWGIFHIMRSCAFYFFFAFFFSCLSSPWSVCTAFTLDALSLIYTTTVSSVHTTITNPPTPEQTNHTGGANPCALRMLSHQGIEVILAGYYYGYFFSHLLLELEIPQQKKKKDLEAAWVSVQ